MMTNSKGFQPNRSNSDEEIFFVEHLSAIFEHANEILANVDYFYCAPGDFAYAS